MVDLDHFKLFNDRYGHLAGDDVLSEMARRVRAVLRDEDLAARFGGEEICLVLPGAEPEQGAAVLERLRQDRAAMCGTDWRTSPPSRPPPFVMPAGAGLPGGSAAPACKTVAPGGSAAPACKTVAPGGSAAPACRTVAPGGTIPAGATLPPRGTLPADGTAAGEDPPGGGPAPVVPAVPSAAVTFSAGVARWWPGEQLQDVLRRADAACYAAKAAGRDRIVVDRLDGNPH